MPVRGELAHRDERARGERVAADLALGVREPAERVGGRVQAYRLLDRHRRALERGRIVECRHTTVQDLVKLVLDEPLLDWVAGEEVEREGQRGGRGLMAGEQEDQRLVAHLLDVHPRAAVGMARLQQPREEIVALGSGSLAARDQLVDELLEGSPGARCPAVAWSWPGRRRC